MTITNDLTQPLRLGLVGLGKIARDQHLPAIAANPACRLYGATTRRASNEAFPTFPDLATMLSAAPEINAVVLCQPPQVRFEAARSALLAGKHVFLEKPPGATLSEVEALIALAVKTGVTLFASWHSREAAGVTSAREWLLERHLQSARIIWKEDVRVWHPGQDWIWEPGGFGVFDPGINALSILTKIVPEIVRVASAELDYPANRHAPIAASLKLATGSDAQIAADFDFLQTGDQTWEIALECSDGSSARLIEGGSRWFIGDTEQRTPDGGEYSRLYARFVDLVRASESDVDLTPLRLVADAFLLGKTNRVAPFDA